MKNDQHATLSVPYVPSRWDTCDRDGRPVPRVVYVGRRYTEYRNPNGSTFVQWHGK